MIEITNEQNSFTEFFIDENPHKLIKLTVKRLFFLNNYNSFFKGKLTEQSISPLA